MAFQKRLVRAESMFNGSQLGSVCALVSEVVSGWQPCHIYQHCEANRILDFIVFAKLNNFVF